jgi:2-polyprenyl-6-methoxyphenol hydroxylase-like FAD-dependent oxidoreductase
VSLRSETRVVVVGAGPVGLSLAIDLARQGIECRILDRNPEPVRESRAIAIQARTLEVFAAMGVVDSVLAAGQRIHGANIVAEGRRILHFNFDELSSPYPFAIDLPQSETERLLAARLAELGVRVERPVEVTSLNQDAAGVSVHTWDSSIRADYAVGCDGAHSTIRKVLELPFEGSADDEHFVLADVPLNWDQPEDEWYLAFHEEGLLTLFPLPGGIYRVIAEAPANTPADVDHLRRIFDERGPKNARFGDPVWLSSFHISHRKVSQYQSHRVFVAGDAAHVHSPAGGQGMNTGIQDAHNLAWKLAMVLRGNAPESLVESYSAEREPVARSVLALTENLTSIATLRHPISQKIRNRLIPILAGFEILEHRLVDRLAEMSINYRSSPIVGQAGRWYTAGPMPGDRAPDANLGEGRHVVDLLRGTTHVVLLFAGDHPGEEEMRGFGNIDRYMREGYPGEISTYLIARGDLAWQGRMVVDRDGNAHHAYTAGVPCVYVIRPDGYIGFRSLSADPLPVLGHLTQVYEPPMKTEG